MTDKLLNVYNEIDWNKSISMINTVGFLGYSLDEYNFSYDKRLKPNEVKTIMYSSILLAIAGGHYAILDVNKPSIDSEIIIRYSDWFFTTPLLIMMLTSYYDLPDSLTYELVFYNMMMIIFGLLYELNNNIIYWFIGTISYLMILYRMYIELPERYMFYKYFVLGWSLYGVIALMPSVDRLIYFNVLDFYNKLVFATEIRNKILKDIEDRI